MMIKLNPGDAIKQNGEVMLFLFGDKVKKCLAEDVHGRVEVRRVEGEVEIIKHESTTTLLRNRLKLLNAKYGDNNEENL